MGRAVCGEASVLDDKLRTDVMGRAHVLGLGHWPLSSAANLVSVPVMLPALPPTHSMTIGWSAWLPWAFVSSSLK